MEQTKVTTKYQTTIPKAARKILGTKAGQSVRWHTLRGVVIVDTHKPVKNPVEILCRQTKANIDAVKLIRQVREELV